MTSTHAPNFALLLSVDGMRLAQRSDTGWLEAGSARWDSPTLTEDLVALKVAAVALESGPIQSKILIPNAQIKYISIEDAYADENDVRAALDGATPYAVDELAYDWRSAGGRTFIAALAKETLEEAESFAVSHGFSPISFAATPEPFTFDGEAFFGATELSKTLLPEGASVDRETTPVVVTGVAVPKTAAGPSFAPMPETVEAPALDAEVEAPLVEDIVAKSPDVEHVKTTPNPTPEPEFATEPDPELDLITDPEKIAPELPDVADVSQPSIADLPVQPEIPDTPADPAEPAFVENEPEMPVFRSRLGHRSDAPIAPAEPPMSALAQTVPAQTDHGQSDHIPSTPPQEASLSTSPPQTPTAPSLGGVARGDATAPPITPVVPDAPEPDWTAPTVTGMAETALPAHDVTARLAAPAEASLAPSAPTPAKKSIGQRLSGIFLNRKARAAATPVNPAANPAGRGFTTTFLSRQKTETQTPEVAAIPIEPRRVATTPPTVQDEADRMTVFGARKPKRTKAAGATVIGGKPRFLGVILTAILLLFMIAVGAFAAMSEQGFARWFGGGSDDTQETVVAVPVAIPSGTPQNDLADAVATAVSLNEGDAPTPEPLSQPEIAAQTEPAQVLSPAEAERLYASTGVWQKAPRVPLVPRIETLDNLYVASIDPAVKAIDAFALPDVTAALTDAVLSAPVDPPPPDAVFDLDNRGLVRATPEGAVTPQGVLVFAGRPPVTPPVRGVIQAVAQVPEPGETVKADTPETTTPVATPGGVSLASFAGSRPRNRPTDLVEQTERSTLGGLSRPELAAFRPRTRPAGLAPEPASEPQVAEVIEEPVVEEEPEEEIVVTAQAVAVSLRPDTRPRNFARVVARAQRNAERATASASSAAAPRTVQPSGPTGNTVAQIATVENAINLREVNLIGVYGRPNARRALVRLANGRYIKVQAGDRLDGGQVAAIGESELRYVKRGRNITISVPSS
jgi:type IV pilus biogenesis protein PilP